MLKPGSGRSTTASTDGSASASPVTSTPGESRRLRQTPEPHLVCERDGRLRCRRVGGQFAVHQHAVAHGQPVVRRGVEEGDVDGDVEIPRPRTVDVDREGVEQLLGRQLRHDRRRRRLGRRAEITLPQLGCAGQEEVAPVRRSRRRTPTVRACRRTAPARRRGSCR